jgi:heme/copper-type cytochrome/quinol oxidase subunit 2
VNPQFRTVALISAALGLLLSLFFVLRPGDDEDAAPTTTVATTTAPATTTAATETEPPATTAPEPPDVVTIRISVPGDTAPTIRHYSVKQGRQVEIVVQSEIADEVHVHGYDLMGDVAPGQPVTIVFKATAPGRFEIELEEHKLPIAELEVRP